MGSEQQSQTGQNWTPPECNNGCPKHCTHQGEEERIIQLHADIDARNRALSLSTMLLVMLLAAEVAFSFLGKPLVLQNMDILWAVVCGSWFGSAGSKLAEIFIQRKANNG